MITKRTDCDDFFVGAIKPLKTKRLAVLAKK
jgi:hypothetical protein